MKETLIKWLGGYTENEYNQKCFEVMLTHQCIIETAKLNQN